MENRTLLRAQCVSTQFRDVIRDSPLLQRKLFFAPATFEQALDTLDGDRERYRNNLAERGLLDPIQPFVVNPGLWHWLKGKRHIFFWDAGRTGQYESFPISCTFFDKSQSYCQMYLAHPMPKIVYIEVMGTEREDDGGVEYFRFEAEGNDAQGPRTLEKLIECVKKDRPHPLHACCIYYGQ